MGSLVKLALMGLERRVALSKRQRVERADHV
jgi:hypothetical protein